MCTLWRCKFTPTRKAKLLWMTSRCGPTVVRSVTEIPQCMCWCCLPKIIKIVRACWNYGLPKLGRYYWHTVYRQYNVIFFYMRVYINDSGRFYPFLQGPRPNCVVERGHIKWESFRKTGRGRRGMFDGFFLYFGIKLQNLRPFGYTVAIARC